jgi:HD superfamily phosphohydrolase YqeK
MNRVLPSPKLVTVLDDVETRSVVYVVSLWVIAVACLATLFGIGQPIGNPYAVALLGLVAAMAERGRIQLSSNLSVSISLVPTLFAAVLFGPLASMVVASASFAAEFRAPYLKWASYTASRALTAFLTGSVALAISDTVSNQLAAVVAATLVGACVSQSVDATFAAVALRLRQQGDIRGTLRTLLPLALAAVPLYAPVVACLAFAYQDVSPFTLPLFFVPTLAAQRFFVLYQDQRHVTNQLAVVNDALEVVNDALERANLSFAAGLVAMLEKKDRYTAGHSEAVAVYARDIAARMDLSASQQQLAYVCGLTHDVGKVGLPAGLLEKPGALTLDERREMQRHSEIGEEILANVETYEEIASVVRHHHERIDGEGYPDGLCGEEIPLLSKIIAVADAYNAMTSDRPYRDAMSSRIARVRLAQADETQFDPAVVSAFEAVLAAEAETYRVADFGRSKSPAYPVSETVRRGPILVSSA